MELTEAGEALLAQACTALEAADRGFEDARAAGRRDRGTLRVAFKAGAAGELTEPILSAFASAHPDEERDKLGLDGLDLKIIKASGIEEQIHQQFLPR